MNFIFIKYLSIASYLLENRILVVINKQTQDSKNKFFAPKCTTISLVPLGDSVINSVRMLFALVKLFILAN